MARKIAVFTGTRAEYGLLFPLINMLSASQEVNLQLYVGGMHLSPEYGYTISQIEEDGFDITARLEFLLSSGSPLGVSKSMALAQMAAAEAIAIHQPDIIVLLGDRFESLAIAQAAMIAQVPIAHIHGGELTEGLIDDAVRHSISKMSHFHFTACEQYRQRVIQLGEQPSTVFNVGAPGLDNIRVMELLTLNELQASVDLPLSGDFVLATYHPVTLAKGGALIALKNMLVALEKLEHQVLITYPNADTFGTSLIELLKDYQARFPNKFLLTQSLGQLRYLSAMKHCKAVIGNSSSGIIEAPSMKVPTVNIGNRQRGRISADSVIDCDESKETIAKAITLALSDEHIKLTKTIVNPYGDGQSSRKIAEVLKTAPLDNILQKRFYDLESST